MITIGIAKWPTDKGKDVGETSLKAKPVPEFVQMIGPYMYPDENDGIRVGLDNCVNYVFYLILLNILKIKLVALHKPKNDYHYVV